MNRRYSDDISTLDMSSKPERKETSVRSRIITRCENSVLSTEQKDISQEAPPNYWYPRVLIIGPGGVKGLKVLGFLSPIEDAGLLEYVDTYCGVSIGAVISLLIVAGYQIREIVGEAATLDIFKDMENLTIQSMLENRGFMSNEPFRKRLTQLILNKFGTIPTLHNLYLLTGKAFIAVTLNATDEECVMMGPFSHPHTSCVDATMFSMNIPFVFYQLVYQGKTYVDGALANPYPIDYFDDGKTDILGIYMRTVHNKPSPVLSTPKPGMIIQRVSDTTKASIPITTYYLKIVYSLMDQRRNNIIQSASDRCKHVCLESQNTDTIGFTITIDDKAHMLVEGFNQGKTFLNQLYHGTYEPPKIPPKLKYEYPPYYFLEDALDQPREVSDPNEPIQVLSAMNS
jgi:predicted acylesterase/phospholipase RssA